MVLFGHDPYGGSPCGRRHNFRDSTSLIAAFSTRMVGTGATEAQIHMAGYVFFVGIVIIMAFGDGAFGILNAFGGEQFPNDVRSTGLGLGYGIGANPAVLAGAPQMVSLIFGGSGIVAAAAMAIILNIVLPKDKEITQSDADV